MQTALALPDFQFLDRQRRKLRRVLDTGLRDLDYLLRDHFRQGVVAILDAERMQHLLVSRCDAANRFRLQSDVLQQSADSHSKFILARAVTEPVWTRNQSNARREFKPQTPNEWLICFTIAMAPSVYRPLVRY